MTAYLLRVFIALDQLLNVVLCNGHPDETMSSNVWRMEQAGKPWGFMRRVIDAIFFFDPSHCAGSYLAERERRHLPPEFRT